MVFYIFKESVQIVSKLKLKWTEKKNQKMYIIFHHSKTTLSEYH